MHGRWPGHDVGPSTTNTVSYDPIGDIELGNRYVRVLRDMCARHAPGVPFVCFADREIGYGVETRILPEGLPGWWGKLYNLKPGQFAHGTRVLALDLDTVIAGPLQPVLDVPLDLPVFIKGTWAYATAHRSGVFSIEVTPETQTIWTDFEHNLVRGKPPYFHPRMSRRVGFWNDEQWFGFYLQPNRFRGWQDVLPGRVLGYKTDLKSSNQPLEKDVAIVYFDGQPRPHLVEAPWNPHLISGATQP
jgi:hypothetical protein